MPQEISYQLNFGANRSSFMREGEGSERFGYNAYNPQFGFVWPSDSPIALFAGVGSEFAHADETSLGSQRHTLVGEAGFHGFLPFAFFRRFNFEVGLRAGAGFSWLNFGGGDNPEPGVDGQVGLLARLMFNLDAFSLGGGVVYGFSPFRGYTELGFGAFLTVPIQPTTGASTESPVDECLKLLALESDVNKDYEEARSALDEAQLDYQKIETLTQDNNSMYELHSDFKSKMESLGMTCPDNVSSPHSGKDITLPKMPKKPHAATCAGLIPKMERYREELKKLHLQLTDSDSQESVHKKLDLALGAAEADKSRLVEWKSDCTAPDATSPTVNTVKVGGKFYILASAILYANDSDDLYLPEQKDLGKNAEHSNPYLDEWLRFLQEHENYKIKIDGYASERYRSDSSYDEEKMLGLATARARKVYEYLILRGIGGSKYKRQNGKMVPIGGPFIPSLLSRPITRDRFVEQPKGEWYNGHGRDDLLEYVRSLYGEGFDLTGLALASDPIFRVVKITVMERGFDGSWRPVPLNQIGVNT